MDPIIGDIKSETRGIEIAKGNIAILAFADDLVLLGKDVATAERQILKLNDYLRGLGRGLSVGKCSTFQIKTAHKTLYVSDPKLKLGDEQIPWTEPDEIIKYLGKIKINPWIGISKNSEVKRIRDAAENISKMKLKPHQKVELIRTYLIPMFIHGIVSAPPSIGTLKAFDNEVRQIVKRILKLHPSTADGIIYTDRNHGGIGIQRIETIVKLVVVRSGVKQRESEDPAVRNALEIRSKCYDKFARTSGISWPTTYKQIEQARINAKKKETESWRKLSSQGQRVKDFGNDFENRQYMVARPKIPEAIPILRCVKTANKYVRNSHGFE